MTNKSIGWRGNTRVVSVRIPEPVAEVIERMAGTEEDLPDRSACLQDAIAHWSMVEQEALDAG